MKRLLALLLCALLCAALAPAALAEAAPAGAEGNVLMRDVPTPAEIEGGEGRVLGSRFSRWSVRSVNFTDDISDAPSDAWDVSEAGDGRVLAWLVGEEEPYDLYIGAQGGVWANEDSSYLFHGYLFAQEFHFNGCFHTERARDMTGMFEWCISLTELDLSDFDTSGTECMSDMFACCANLRALDVTSFDTARVTDMGYMFCACTSLGELDVTGFDTAQVTDMEGMFTGTNLERLDLRGFDTGRVESMKAMFLGCGNLKEISVGEGFVIGADTDTEQMFEGCEQLPNGGEGLLNS